MRYIANPVAVDAWPITLVGVADPETGDRSIYSGNRSWRADAGMLARMTPVVGDYVVLQADGYLYLNPKDVFERKYRPDEPNALELGAAVRAAGLAGK